MVIPIFHAVFAYFLIRITFQDKTLTARYTILFCLLSCTIGGVVLMTAQFAAKHGISQVLSTLNWKVYLLASTAVWVILTVFFRGNVRHSIRGELMDGTISLDGNIVHIRALYDTGHTLSDPFTGASVITVWHHALWDIISDSEKQILCLLEDKGAMFCMERLSEIVPGRYRLIPYCCVGVKDGMLLSLRADNVALNGKTLGAISVALSPTPVSAGGGYTALWGGEYEGKINEIYGKSDKSSVNDSWVSPSR